MDNIAESVYPFLNTIEHAKKRAFLTAFCDTFDVSRAAERIGVGRGCHYYWLHEDPEYLKAFRAAKQVAAETLESELTRRALQGVRRHKFYKGEPIMVPCPADHPEAVQSGSDEHPDFRRPYCEQEYSDTLGIFIMKGAMPEKYRERYEYHDGDRDINDTIERELEVLANRETSIAAAGDSEPGGNGRHKGNGDATPSGS